VPGSGSVETWDMVIDNDYCYGHLSFSGLRSAKPLVDQYWQHVAARDGDANPHRMAFTQICCVAETDAQAEADYADAVRYFYTHNPTYPGFATPPGYQSLASLRHQLENGFGRGVSAEDRIRAARGEMSFWEYDEKGYIIAGTPRRVAARLRELVTDLRVGQLIATLSMGNLAEEVAAKNTELFGREVIPQLEDIWSDQPDHWTPKVSQERVAEHRAARKAPAGATR
jgi:alkanesulfonate monooxygenase SsuD/methylene tetrahydromethanopterin reductase-like flavin-dependent oxidoreductase (luciferase family)